MDRDEGLGCWLTRLSQVSAQPSRTAELHESFGEFCHTLRNRLQSLNLSLYMGRRNGSLPAEACGRFEGHYQQFERLVDQLQWTCRPSDLQPVHLPLGLLVEDRRGAWDGCLAGRDCRLVVVEAVDEAPGWYDPGRLTTALDALVAWRAEDLPPGSLVEIGWRVRRGRIQFDWAESGEAPTASGQGGATRGSLALAMLGRAMADHRGTLVVTRDPDFAVSLRWEVAGAPGSTTRETRAALTGRPG